jgi:NAD-dependent deacetylase
VARSLLCVLSGAGISAESGIRTFRDSNGLWENHRVEDVASPEGWKANPSLVLDFYNKRRAQLLSCQPNPAHYALASLEKIMDVVVITQNVDDLHERAGSTQVIHLHGELRKVRSTVEEEIVYSWDTDLKWGDCCEKGHQLRPHIVWFGEQVPELSRAIPYFIKADYLAIIGTSLLVYPAAGLIHYCRPQTKKYYVDLHADQIPSMQNLQVFQTTASDGVQQMIQSLTEK